VAEEKARVEAAARRKAEEEQARRVAEEKARADAAARQKAEEDAQRAADEKAKAEAKRQAEAGEQALRLSEADCKRVQVALTSLGFDTQGADGALGPRSRQMITLWQKSRGYPDSGFLNGPQMAALQQQAAPALARYEEEQKRRDEDKRKAEEETKRKEDEARRKAADEPARRDQPSPPPQQAAAPPARAGVAAFDGAYSGKFCYNFRDICQTVTIRISGGAASGTWSRGLVVHTLTGTVAASGEVRLSVEWHSNTIKSYAPLKGSITNGRLVASGAYVDSGQPARFDVSKSP
jgi:peptidoglycan hydrolase-like protein with peptidoglycan-binding domain